MQKLRGIAKYPYSVYERWYGNIGMFDELFWVKSALADEFQYSYVCRVISAAVESLISRE